METKPNGFSLNPFAIRISFTANYSLQTCNDLLFHIQALPSRWRSFLGAPRLEFRVLSIDTDLCVFYADRKVGKAEVLAKGHFQKIDDEITLVTGYSDAKISFYLFLLLGMGMILFVAARLYNGTMDGLYVSSHPTPENG